MRIMGIKHKPTSVKNPQANALMEQVHQVITTLLHTTDLDMANTVVTSDINAYLMDTAWAIHSTYLTVLKASPGEALFGQDMLFDILFLAEWNKIGDHRQGQTDLYIKHENRSRCDWCYKVGEKVLLRKDGIICKSESQYECDHWTITSVHTNGIIRVQCRPNIEMMNR
jgi:hypothetical protein